MKLHPGVKAMFYKKCKEAGVRITPQRETVYSCIVFDKSHPSADYIYRKAKGKLPNVSFDTVNRTLALFADMGLIKIVEGQGRPKRFDAETEKHHHFQCLKCSRIADFRNSGYDRLKVPADIEKRFRVTGKKVVLEGFCDKCGGQLL